MPAYLVRLIDTHDLVGIYSVDTIFQLIIIIDECTDPGACEYTRLRAPGGVMWESPAVCVPVERPADADGTEPDTVPWDAVSLTERWWNVLYGHEECRWKRFYPDDPPVPMKRPLRRTAGQVPFKKKSG